MSVRVRVCVTTSNLSLECVSPNVSVLKIQMFHVSPSAASLDYVSEINNYFEGLYKAVGFIEN